MMKPNKVSPFPAPAKTARRSGIDSDLLIVERGVKPPSFLRRERSKYDDVFEQLGIGDCIRCENGEHNTIATALRKFVKTRGMKAIVRSLGRCDDGAARVWLLKA